MFKTKLLPLFTGPFTVVGKKGLAYTLNLQRKLSTQPVFYIGILNRYRDLSSVRLKGLAPLMVAVPRIVSSATGYQVAPPNEVSSS